MHLAACVGQFDPVWCRADLAAERARRSLYYSSRHLGWPDRRAVESRREVREMRIEEARRRHEERIREGRRVRTEHREREAPGGGGEPDPEPEPVIARAVKPRGSLEDAIRARRECVPCRSGRTVG